MSGRLTPQQVQHFREEGYLLFDQPVFPQPKSDALKSHFESRLVEFVESTGKPPEAFDVPHFEDVKLFEWLFAEEVLDVVESLIGPDIALWSSHFISKPPGVGKRVPWHEDSAYWGKVLDPMEVVTVWLAIDQSTPENGCMRVVPRTHGGGYSEYEPVRDAETSVFHAEIKAGKFDESTAVDCVLEPNHCSIHHAKLIHGSTPTPAPAAAVGTRCGTCRRRANSVRGTSASVRFRSTWRAARTEPATSTATPRSRTRRGSTPTARPAPRRSCSPAEKTG
jgi:hypothetical protein